jgi:A/G-specific adenine glycosylase
MTITPDLGAGATIALRICWNARLELSSGGGPICPFTTLLLSWGKENKREFPWRSVSDAFAILVAEVLLQRSRGRTVAKVYDELLDRWPDADVLAAAPVHEIEDVIRPLGLIRRAETLRSLAEEVAARGSVPRTLEELMALPGVGRYAASATLAAAFGRRVPTVDGVSARVYRRYFGLPGERPPVSDPDLWDLVARVTPERRVREWNWAVLDLAALVCVPKRPRCDACPVRARCTYARNVRVRGDS